MAVIWRLYGGYSELDVQGGAFFMEAVGEGCRERGAVTQRLHGCNTAITSFPTTDPLMGVELCNGYNRQSDANAQTSEMLKGGRSGGWCGR